MQIKYYKQLITILTHGTYVHHTFPTERSVFTELDWNIFAKELNNRYGENGWVILNILTVKANLPEKPEKPNTFV